jgi:hypothetical protein
MKFSFAISEGSANTFYVGSGRVPNAHEPAEVTKFDLVLHGFDAAGLTGLFCFFLCFTVLSL